MELNYFKDGTFFLGVNYWASHAGTMMWRDWRPEIVEKDMKELAANGVKVIRAFPLWCDFQPITKLLGGEGVVNEISHGERFLDQRDPADRAGVSKVMIERFKTFCGFADKYGIKLIIALLNGWMSGRDFIPPALVGHDYLTDPFALKWELKFVKYFVSELKSQKNIILWEPGNECNCLGKVNTESEAFVWMGLITDAIRSVDPTRPVASGMHGLFGNWNIAQQAEFCEYLTIHPYVLFTPYCNEDGLLSARAIQHAAAELTLYSDISGKPCFVEEIGSLCSTFGDDETVAKFVRAGLFNAWAHNGYGYLWWCGFDQMHLTNAPYEWCDVERELGIMRVDHTPKPLAKEFAKFTEVIEKLPFKLPVRKRDAICLLDSRHWSVAFGSFLLAKRAGIELKFAEKSMVAEDCKLYLIPGSPCLDFLRKTVSDDLYAKIENGATAFITADLNVISQLEKWIGCRSKGRVQASSSKVTFQGKEYALACTYKMKLEAVDAEVLAYDEKGLPAFVYHKIGKGGVYYLNACLERSFGESSGVTLCGEEGVEVFYRYIAEKIGITHNVTKTNPLLDVTEHDLNESESVVVVMNNTEDNLSDVLKVNGVTLNEVYYGKAESTNEGIFVNADAADCVIFSVRNEA